MKHYEPLKANHPCQRHMVININKLIEQVDKRKTETLRWQRDTTNHAHAERLGELLLLQDEMVNQLKTNGNVNSIYSAKRYAKQKLGM